MLQNIKVDIIYYLTATDFEMEFNLCGCCRMRLLTDKASDRKDFVHQLSRAVSRSRVIICCGPLFGESGLISGVSAAIGRTLETADNKAYGIAGDDEIQIIKGSMPLVTSNGIFGGCIIESGPQSIILLSESKGIRKTLMSSLIHPYIEDISYVPKEVQDHKETAGADIQVEAIGAAVPVTPVVPVAPIVMDIDASKNEESEPSEELTTQENAEQTDGEMAENVSNEEDTSETVEENKDVVEETETTEEIELITEEQPIEEAEIIEESIEGLITESDEIEAEEQTEEFDLSQQDSEAPFVFEQEDLEEEPEKIDLTEEAQLVLPEEEIEDEIPMQEIAQEYDTGLFIESQDVKFTKKNYYETDYVAGAGSEHFFSEPDEYVPAPTFRVPLIVLSVVLLAALAVLAYLLVFVPLRDGVAVSDYIKNLFEVTRKIGLPNKFF